MFRFFDAIKKSVNKKTSPVTEPSISQQLIDILRPDEETEITKKDPKAAFNFYMQHKDEPVDVYLVKNYLGSQYTLLDLCILADKDLFYALLDNPYLHSLPTHPWGLVFNMLTSYSQKEDINTTLFNFFKARIPKTSILNGIDEFYFPKINDENIFNFHFADYPSSEIWRLLIDGRLQKKEQGWIDYEKREFGSVKALLNGLKFVKETIDLPLTSDLLRELHHACSNNVKKLEANHSPGKFRNESFTSFGLIYDINATVPGLIELYQNMKSDQVSYMLWFGKIELPPVPSASITHKVDSIIEKYNHRIERATTPKKKLYCIIRLCSALERAHPFDDANSRTICIFLLNRELMRNGFSPVILEDPNRFDGYSKRELFNEIIMGMKTFRLVKDGLTETLGISSKEIDKLARRSNDDAIVDLADTIKNPTMLENEQVKPGIKKRP